MSERIFINYAALEEYLGNDQWQRGDYVMFDGFEYRIIGQWGDDVELEEVVS